MAHKFKCSGMQNILNGFLRYRAKLRPELKSKFEARFAPLKYGFQKETSTHDCYLKTNVNLIFDYSNNPIVLNQCKTQVQFVIQKYSFFEKFKWKMDAKHFSCLNSIFEIVFKL